MSKHKLHFEEPEVKAFNARKLCVNISELYTKKMGQDKKALEWLQKAKDEDVKVILDCQHGPLPTTRAHLTEYVLC